jgi:hypothetical protein
VCWSENCRTKGVSPRTRRLTFQLARPKLSTRTSKRDYQVRVRTPCARQAKAAGRWMHKQLAAVQLLGCTENRECPARRTPGTARDACTRCMPRSEAKQSRCLPRRHRLLGTPQATACLQGRCSAAIVNVPRRVSLPWQPLQRSLAAVAWQKSPLRSSPCTRHGASSCIASRGYPSHERSRQQRRSAVTEPAFCVQRGPC